mmetsp:Transcript_12942/g.26166  ORF Transcript_12942/g.26166 Transcript_12942/m.26166 type:complete len:90 (+) Transcript_12942:879-1148(+)
MCRKLLNQICFSKSSCNLNVCYFSQEESVLSSTTPCSIFVSSASGPPLVVPSALFSSCSALLISSSLVCTYAGSFWNDETSYYQLHDAR